MNALGRDRNATQNTPVGLPRRAEDSVRSTARATRPDFDLPDPLAYAADTDYQHRLLLTLGELEATRPQFSAAAAASVDRLPAVVVLAATWVGRLADRLAELVPADDANAAVTDALATAGQFLEAARELADRPAGWSNLFGVLAAKKTGSTRKRLEVLATAPVAFERLLVALALGFQLPEFSAEWVATATTFARDLRRDLAWTISGTV